MEKPTVVDYITRECCAKAATTLLLIKSACTEYYSGCTVIVDKTKIFLFAVSICM